MAPEPLPPCHPACPACPACRLPGGGVFLGVRRVAAKGRKLGGLVPKTGRVLHNRKDSTGKQAIWGRTEWGRVAAFCLHIRPEMGDSRGPLDCPAPSLPPRYEGLSFILGVILVILGLLIQSDDFDDFW